MKKIEPTILKGTRDFLPEEMAKRNFVMRKIQGIFERYGYAPLETPILSPADTILGKYGEEGDRLTYSFEDKGERRIALPYDLTVPFARYVAANWRDLPIPFKRYQIQRVWRAEKPQKGRLREFYQCDIDVVGTRSLLVEAEVARVITEVFEVLGIPDFKIRVNSRRLMNEVLLKFGVASEAAAVIRTIDKLDKIGFGAVVDELSAVGVREPEKLMALLSKEDSTEKTLMKFGGFDTAEIIETISLAKDIGVPAEVFEFDPSLARGLDYYTGVIYEVVSSKADFGTLCAGGRYDNLTELFETTAPKDQETSGMGVAFGFERIMIVLEELGLFAETDNARKVLVAQFKDTEVESRKFYGELIAAGIPAEIYFESAKMEKQFKFADKKGIAFVAMLGADEAGSGEVSIKDLRSGSETKVPRAEAMEFLKAA